MADARLSQGENTGFLERFRYILIASQLLNETINVSHYNRKAEHMAAPSEDDSDSTAFFGPRFAKARFWAGNSFCIGVVTVLVGWVLRWGEENPGAVSKGRAALALLGTSIVGIFLFTHARRRWLRTLRGRAIELANQYVESSQNFDILVSDAVTFIQEVELVSRGYRLYVQY